MKEAGKELNDAKDNKPDPKANADEQQQNAAARRRR